MEGISGWFSGSAESTSPRPGLRCGSPGEEGAQGAVGEAQARMPSFWAAFAAEERTPGIFRWRTALFVIDREGEEIDASRGAAMTTVTRTMVSAQADGDGAIACLARVPVSTEMIFPSRCHN